MLEWFLIFQVNSNLKNSFILEESQPVFFELPETLFLSVFLLFTIFIEIANTYCASVLMLDKHNRNM